jgi:hypothetical protein
VFPQARGGLDDLHSAVRLVLVNSSRAWSSSGGVVVIERPSGGVANRRQLMAAAPGPDPVGPEPAIDGIAGGAGAVMPAVGADRAVCDPLTWWPSDACVYCVVGPLAVGESPAGFEVLRGRTGR